MKPLFQDVRDRLDAVVFYNPDDTKTEDALWSQAFRELHENAPTDIAKLLKAVDLMAEVLWHIEFNYDHDSDAHRDGTSCRVCESRKALEAVRQLEVEDEKT